MNHSDRRTSGGTQAQTANIALKVATTLNVVVSKYKNILTGLHVQWLQAHHTELGRHHSGDEGQKCGAHLPKPANPPNRPIQ